MHDNPLQDPALHTELALTYIDEVLSFLADETVSKLWRAKSMGFITFPFPRP
jgi:vacuolar protein sorting-associated protein 3